MDRHGKRAAHLIFVWARTRLTSIPPDIEKDSQEIQDILLNRSAEFDRASMTSNLLYPFCSGGFL
jgi:hypothetical protein